MMAAAYFRSQGGAGFARQTGAVLLVLAVWAVAGKAQTAATTAVPNQPPAAGGAAPPRRAAPAPKTPEEAAAYQAFLNESKPEERIRRVEDFLLQFPETELKEAAYQAAMQAYQATNDINRLLMYGELTLQENPDNLVALLTLAAAIAETSDRNEPDFAEKLADGEQYAQRALEVLARLRKPPGFPEDRWLESRRESESAAHGARGLMALLRGDFVKAELELQEAVALTSKPDALLLYRLGLSYSFLKKYERAVETLDRAAALGGIKVSDGAGGTRDLVAEARDFAARALAGGMEPQSPEPAMEKPPDATEPAPGGEPVAAPQSGAVP